MSLISTLTATAVTAAALQATGVEPSASLRQIELQEVVITARRREERLQDTPISVSAVAGQVLTLERLDRVADYSAKISNFNALQQNTRVSTLTIRGVGGNANSDGSEAGVGLIVDNVFFTHPGFSWLDFVDLASVEVARGPQGTLLGKNTTIGAVIVTTQRPSFTPEATVSATIANHQRYQLRANLSGPLSDQAAGRLTLYGDTSDGWITNRPTGDGYLDTGRWAVRGQLLYEGGALSNRLIAEQYATREFNNFYPPVGDPLTYVNGAPRNGWARRLQSAFGYSPSYDLEDANLDTQEELVSRTTGLSNQADWRLGEHTITSITAWRKLYFRPRNDGDNSPFPIFHAGYDVDVDQYSQELRLASASGGALDYQAGIFLLRQDVTSNFRTLFYADATAFFLSPALPALILDGVEASQLGKAKTFSGAVFGQATWRPTERAALTLGARYTQERKAASNAATSFGGVPLTGTLTPLQSYRVAVASPPFLVSEESEDGSVSWLINPSYKISQDLLAYASIGYGEKSGAANLGAKPGDRVIIDPEKSTDFELGLKTTWLDGRAILNGNLYWNDIEDYQATLSDTRGATSRSYLANVGKVRMRGLELEGQLQATPELNLSFSAALNDARYVSYPSAPVPQEYAYPGGPGSLDLSDTRVPNAPRFTGQVSARYEQPLIRGGTVFAYGNQTWRSDTFTHAISDHGRQDAYGLTNIGLGYRTMGDRYAVQVWARNLFDERYAAAFGQAGGSTPYIAILGEPRTFGVTLTAKPF
ncbi:TonB-dependent receptor [Phenylobacterium sp.]|uniref:TonB-dependent receptor n=1 Tax=Phenylobacterium sp. TaxID=1871053 RepID=UPI0027321FE2|nr:TonB-dependent receptor [Phenylobacterium sp.]MDP1618107.1 TonB-dependent receptor [Phenylobacterium sp.]MDP1986460.1 TonB-dependent receptor [Phenylobacterium sp.]